MKKKFIKYNKYAVYLYDFMIYKKKKINDVCEHHQCYCKR